MKKEKIYPIELTKDETGTLVSALMVCYADLKEEAKDRVCSIVFKIKDILGLKYKDLDSVHDEINIYSKIIELKKIIAGK